ncbi:uncharacterized protein LOC125179262 [Hyalella azteca]|uniref:Uncharacterized protein LOC125179262 n=1 Tax=Hyalella azteca TaxID=294128 RepID=A0A979FW54_HYAAZ|nr:uncharacterized protein LOC125179262 [Hyalella azteca]
MNMDSFLSVLLLAVFPFVCAGQNFGRYSDYTIKASSVSSYGADFPSKCHCRSKCFFDPSCVAVAISATPAASSSYTCKFTAAVAATGQLLQPHDFLEHGAGIDTYVKGFSCYPPLQLILGVGCLYISTDEKNFADAKAIGCPAGTKLYAPPSQDSYFKLAEYLMRTGTTTDYWVWVNKLPNNTWVWEDGKYSYGTAVYQQGVWATGNPGGASSDKCGKMRRSANYKMSDRSCTESYKYICTMA